MMYTMGGIALLLSPIALVVTIIFAIMKKSVWKKSLLLTLILFVVSMIIGFGGRLYQYNAYIVYTIGCVIIMCCLFAVLRKASKDADKARKLLSNDEKQARIDQEYLDSIIKTVIVDSSHIATSNVSTGSAVGRAVVGGAVFGGIGAVVGASTAKHKVTEKHSTTFLVYYVDGTQKAITVDNGSKQYNMYLSKLAQ